MIHTNRSHLQIAAQTHPGMSGKNNEDNFAVTSHYIDAEKKQISTLAVIADGIGGHRAGEVASEIAVNSICQIVADSNAAQPLHVLENAITTASETIRTQADSQSNHFGMGATCAVAWVINNNLYTATVGDTRIYLLRGEHIQQVSIDHTWIQEALERGIITPDQVDGHPNAHVIRRYLGAPTPPEPDFRLQISPEDDDRQAISNQGFRLQTGDIVLLCSDGLSDLVNENEINQIVRGTGTLEKAVQTLISLANERGGHDNITIALLSVPKGYQQTPVKKKSDLSYWLAVGLIGLFLLLIGLIAWFWNWLKPFDALSSTPTAFITEPVIVETSTPTPVVKKTESVFSATPAATYTPWPTNTPSP